MRTLTVPGAALMREAKARGMRSGELAAMLGVSLQTLLRKKSGESDFSLEDVRTIAHEWGVWTAVQIFLSDISHI